MENQLNMIPVLFLHGLNCGMLIFLVASGLTLVLGMMDILNFAHASIYMIGAFICYQMIQWTNNFWLALVSCPVNTFHKDVSSDVASQPLGYAGYLRDITLGGCRATSLVSTIVLRGGSTHCFVASPRLPGV